MFVNNFLPSNRCLFKLLLRFMKKIMRVILAFSLCTQATLAQDKKNTEIDAFAAKTGAVVTIDKATNSLNFLRFPAAKTFKQTGGSTDQKALSFLAENKGLFAMQPDDNSFINKGKKKDSHGFEHVLMQQYFKGVPVFDGLMKFHFNENVELVSINGNFNAVDKLNPVPSITKEDAAFKLYPNPAQSVLTVELPDAFMQSVHARIINMLGQKVLVRKNLKVTDGNLNFDLGTLSSGIYQEKKPVIIYLFSSLKVKKKAQQL